MSKPKFKEPRPLSYWVVNIPPESETYAAHVEWLRLRCAALMATNKKRFQGSAPATVTNCRYGEFRRPVKEEPAIRGINDLAGRRPRPGRSK